MKYGSLFTGIGGFDLGFDRAGMQCAWQVEIDNACRQVLERHWPDVRRHKDVRQVGAPELEPVELICGGFPCQDVSIAGRRAGLAGERSGLWFEFARIVEELKPGWVVIENVPGLLSSNGGGDFAAVVQGLVKLGYGVCWRVLDAQYFGIPQRRRRLFVVASLGSGRSAEVLFERECGNWDSAPSRETRQANSGQIAFSPFSHYGYEQAEEAAAVHNFRQFTGAQNLVADAVTSKMAKRSCGPSGDEARNLVMWEGDAGEQSYSGVRRLTPLECERLQGFPGCWTFGSDTTRYRQLGNAVAVPCAQWIAARIINNRAGIESGMGHAEQIQ